MVLGLSLPGVTIYGKERGEEADLPRAEPLLGFPGGASGKEPVCQCRTHKRYGFHPWIKIPWREAWQPTPVFLPGESLWTEEPYGLPSIGLQRVGCN